MDVDNFGSKRAGAYTQAVKSNAADGALVITLGLTLRALGDDRCKRGHRVIVKLIAIAFRDGLEACPSVDWLSTMSGISVGAVKNVLSDLTAWDYFTTVRKAPSGGGRAVAHYTVALAGRVALEQQIEHYLSMLDQHPEVILCGDVRKLRSSSAVTSGSKAEVIPGNDLSGLRSSPAMTSETAAYKERARPRAPLAIVKIDPCRSDNEETAATGTNVHSSIELRKGQRAALQAQELVVVRNLDLVGGAGVGGEHRIKVVLADGRQATATRGEVLNAAKATGFPELHAWDEAVSIMAGLAQRPKAWCPPNMLAFLREQFGAALAGMQATAARAKVQLERAQASPQGKAQLEAAGGQPRRYVRDLERLISNQAFMPMSYGAANDIMQTADGLREGEPIAQLVDFVAVLGAVEKGEQPSHDYLAALVAHRAARRVSGLSDGGRWLKSAAALIAEFEAKWPHVDAGVIAAQVDAVSFRPELAGVLRQDWSVESEAKVAAVLRTFMPRVIEAIRKKRDPVKAWTEFCLEGDSSDSTVNWWLDQAAPDAQTQNADRGAVAQRIASHLPAIRAAWGVADLAAMLRPVIIEAMAAVYGPRIRSIAADAIPIIEKFKLEKPYQLVMPRPAGAIADVWQPSVPGELKVK